MPKDLVNAGTVLGRIRPRRQIEGISAVLLPFCDSGRPDNDALAAIIARTADAGLTPAVNMDTGYVDRLSPDQRAEVLRVTKAVLRDRPFVAGVFVEDREGDLIARYREGIEAVETLGGTPILFQCSDLAALPGPQVVTLYRRVAVGSRRLLAFELGRQFAPFGRIYDLDTVRGIMEI